MSQRFSGRPFTLPGRWASIRLPGPLSMRAWRMASGSPSACPPASPQVAITVRRFGGRAFSAQDLVEIGSLPERVLQSAQEVLVSRRNILVSGGTGSGKTTLLNALIELLPENDASWISRIPWSYGSPGPTVSASRRGTWRGAPSPSGSWSGTHCGTGPITSWWARCEAARLSIFCRPSILVTVGR